MRDDLADLDVDEPIPYMPTGRRERSDLDDPTVLIAVGVLVLAALVLTAWVVSTALAPLF